MKRVAATQDQKDSYQGMYPLHSYLKDDNGLLCAVEDMRGRGCRGGEEDPQWEVIAPTGYIFDCIETHSILGGTLKDVIERTGCYKLVKCDGVQLCGGIV